MDIEDVMDFLEENPIELEKIFINFEKEFQKILSQDYNHYRIVNFVSSFYEREQRKIIVKELLNTL